MKTYRLGIDGNEANVVNRVGSNVFAWELLQALYRHWSTGVNWNVTVYLSAPPIAGWPESTDWWQYKVIPPAKLWTQWRLPLELYQHRQLDLFFSPGHYLPRWSPVPTVPTIMDLAFEYYPDCFRHSDYLQLHNWTRRSVQQARHVFAISESTRQDISQHYGRRKSDITVIYPAVKSMKKINMAEIKQILATQDINAPYLLYVGTLQPRKNIERLVGAWEKLVQKGWPGLLVLAGRSGWLSEPIQTRIAASPYRDRIRQTGFVEETTKRALIQGAECSVLISLYEGFGIPPLESIQLGTIPVVSNNSSLPEVVGSGGCLVDPLDENDITRGLEEIINLDHNERDKRLGQMWAHASQFSWQNSAQRVDETLLGLVTGTHVL